MNLEIGKRQNLERRPMKLIEIVVWAIVPQQSSTMTDTLRYCIYIYCVCIYIFINYKQKNIEALGKLNECSESWLGVGKKHETYMPIFTISTALISPRIWWCAINRAMYPWAAIWFSNSAKNKITHGEHDNDFGITIYKCNILFL